MGLGKSNLKLTSTKFKGIYRGLVMSNADSSQYGRIKIKVFPMLVNVETENLPYAAPAYPIVEGAGDGIGYFAVPDVGTHVFVFFEQGDIYQPVYFAEAPDALKGLPEARTTNYPHRKVIKTSSGIEIFIDDVDTQLRINHPTGTYILIDTDGTITAHSKKDVVIDADINVNIHSDVDTVVDSDRDIIGTANRDVNVTANNDIKTNSARNTEMTIGGNLLLNIAGIISVIVVNGGGSPTPAHIQITGPLHLESDDVITIEGSEVRINP